MVALVSMKMSKEEVKEQASPSSDSLPQYSWGLSIHLDDDALEKLGIGDGLKVGDKVSVIAKATVEASSSHKSLLGDSESSVDLQLTDMEIGNASSKVTETLYDK